MSDRIELTLPADEELRPVANLVVGGLGARLELTYEHLDDLQTALDALLARRDDGGDITIAIEISNEVIRSTVGPFPDGGLRDLGEDSQELGLRRVLETVTDGVEVERRDGATFVVLITRTAATAGAAG
jgi:anti-sigma regulatory factor (Ser/Thr protein kinase)